MDDRTTRILALSAEGLSIVEVAERLDLPVVEVRARFRAALTELGARSRLEGLVLAIRAGLIDQPNGSS